MWNRRKEEEPTSRPSGSQPSNPGGNEGVPNRAVPGTVLLINPASLQLHCATPTLGNR